MPIKYTVLSRKGSVSKKLKKKNKKPGLGILNVEVAKINIIWELKKRQTWNSKRLAW